MLSFRMRCGFGAATVACLLMLLGGMQAAAHAQDGVVMITDSYTQKKNQKKSTNNTKQTKKTKKRVDRSVKRSNCESGSCSLGTCDSGCCDSGCCDVGCCGDCCAEGCCGDCCCLPWWAHRSGVAGTFLYLHTTDADVAYAQQQNGTGGAGTVPFGRIGSLGPHHEPGFRASATKAFSNCSSLVLTYSFFESDSIDALELGNGGAVGSLVHHPGAAITASTGPITAAYDVDFQLADFAYRSLWKGTDHYAVNWSVGGRYGSLTQDFRSIGIFSGGQAGTIDTLTRIDFDGGGLTLGLDGERRFGCSGWSIYSKGLLGTLSGRFHADYHLNNSTVNPIPPNTQPSLAIADWEDDRMVTTLDLEVGLNWTSKKGKLTASAGYMASYWFNTLTTSEFINSVQANNYTSAEDTLSFTGLTTSIGVQW